MSRLLAAAAAFVYQEQGCGFPAFVQNNRVEGSCQIPFLLPSETLLMADTSSTAAWNHWERCVGLWEGDLLLLPSLVCWGELRVALLSTQLMLSLLTAGAGLYKPLPMRHVQMLRECSVLCMHMTYSKMYFQVYFK